MAIELSARTFDWERMHRRGKGVLDTFSKGRKKPDVSKNYIYDALVQHVPEKNMSVLESGDGDWAIEYGGSDTLYGVTFKLINGEFTASIKVRDATESKWHTLIDTESGVDRIDTARKTLQYVFHVRQSIEAQTDETLLSERELEVALLLSLEGYGLTASQISSVLGIDRSNVSEYCNRLEERAEEARNQIEIAERTLKILEGTERVQSRRRHKDIERQIEID